MIEYTAAGESAVKKIDTMLLANSNTHYGKIISVVVD